MSRLSWQKGRSDVFCLNWVVNKTHSRLSLNKCLSFYLKSYFLTVISKSIILIFHGSITCYTREEKKFFIIMRAYGIHIFITSTILIYYCIDRKLPSLISSTGQIPNKLTMRALLLKVISLP